MKEDEIIRKLIEHDKRFDETVAKNEFDIFSRQVLDGQDEMITILKRLDQERIFTIEWVRRIETEVEQQKLEITRMKQVLNLA